MSKTFRAWDVDQAWLLPPSVHDFVPAGHPAHLIREIVREELDLGGIVAQRGEPMPEGWMVGRDGRPLTDPNRREEGLLLPIGVAKGYGLALAIGLLAGTLNGAAFGRGVVDFTKEPGTATNTGQFVAAIALDAFGDPNAFGAAVDAAFDDLRASAPLPGHEPVRIPGEARGATWRDRLAAGLPLHASLLAELGKIAAELEIPAPATS